MPYTFANVPVFFQSMKSETLNQNVIAYIDDILIYSQTKQEHIQHVKTILTWLDHNQLYIKAKKCESQHHILKITTQEPSQEPSME